MICNFFCLISFQLFKQVKCKTWVVKPPCVSGITLKSLCVYMHTCAVPLTHVICALHTWTFWLDSRLSCSTIVSVMRQTACTQARGHVNLTRINKRSLALQRYEWGALLEHYLRYAAHLFCPVEPWFEKELISMFADALFQKDKMEYRFLWFWPCGVFQ